LAGCDEQVRVCNTCFDKATGARGVEEPPTKTALESNVEKDLERVVAVKKANDKKALFGSIDDIPQAGQTDELNGKVVVNAPPVDELKAQRDRARAAGQAAINTSADTMETVDRQLHQTQADNRKLIKMNELLAESEQSLRELEMGMFSLLSSNNKKVFSLPPEASDDVTVRCKMNPSFMSSGKEYDVRFTHTIMMRMTTTKPPQLSDSVPYRHVEKVTAMNDGSLVITFKGLVAQPEWKCVLGKELQSFVRELWQRSVAVEEDLLVRFNGVTEFQFKSAAAVAKADKAKPGDVAAKKKPKTQDAWGMDDEEDQEFNDDILNQLDTIQNQNKEINGVLKNHQGALENQAKLLKETTEKIKIQDARAKDIVRVGL